MTEKRFSIWDCNGMEDILNTFVQDSEKEGQESTLLTHKECCEELNALYEENEQLKAEINQLKHDLALYEEETAKELGIDWNE